MNVCLKWLMATALLTTAPYASGASGVLTGRVQAAPRVRAHGSSGDSAYADRDLRYAARFDYEHLKHAVVYAQPLDPQMTAPVSVDVQATLLPTRENAKLVPEFLLSPPGCHIRFHNRTSQAATLFASGDSVETFALRLMPSEEKRACFETPGLYRLHSLPYSEAGADLLVAGPYAVLADAQGVYRLELPPGKYDVTAWHPRLPAQTQRVEVGEAKPVKLDFMLSVMQLPEIK